jgi:hypothetical protein
MADHVSVQFGANITEALRGIDRVRQALTELGREPSKGVGELNNKIREGDGLPGKFAERGRETLASLGALAGITAAGFTFEGIVSSIEEMARAAERLTNVSSALGVSTRQWSEFGAVMRLAGGDSEKATRGFLAMEQALQKALQEPLSKEREAFGKLGFSGEDLQKGLEQPLEMLHKMRKIWEEKPAGAAGVAPFTDIFGRRGIIEMSAFLNQTDEDIKEAIENARRFGKALIYLTPQDARASVGLRDGGDDGKRPGCSALS